MIFVCVWFWVLIDSVLVMGLQEFLIFDWEFEKK